MSEKWLAYVNDPRTICKYGSKCYQQNPDHHQKYKHPPHNGKRTIRHQKPINKRFKPSPITKNQSPRDHGRCHLDKNPSEDDSVDQDNSKHQDNGDEDSLKEKALDRTSNIETSLASNSIIQNDETSYEIKLPKTLEFHDKDADNSVFKELFLVTMPPDFFHFFKCLSEDPNFIKTLASVNLELIGPFDLLMGKLPVLEDEELYLIHWRFFFDPPEFQAVLKKKGKSEYHIGYFRDSPDEAPVFLASSESNKGCQITPLADNIFGAVYLYLQKEKSSSPFISVACQRLMEKVKNWAEEHKYLIGEYNKKNRLKDTVTKTLHGAGIVVPYNKKTELGYRKLAETDVNLRKLFTKLEEARTQAEKDKLLSELQPVITYAEIAVDECDFGTGLEAGIDLFCSGLKELQPSTLSSLCAVYPLLKRDAFSKIIQAHMKYRRKGPDMSVLSGSRN